MMKYCLILFVLAMAGNTCSQNKKDPICQEWTLVKTVDPYQGGTVNMRDSTNWKTMEFKKDGSFLEQDPWNKVEGMWKFNEDRTKLGMAATIQNGKEVSKDVSIEDFRWSVFTLSKEEMILGIQGRHGVVKHYYKKAPK